MVLHFPRRWAVAALALALAAAGVARAAGPAGPAAYEAAAEKDGSVVWYTTMNAKDLDETVKAFAKRYPKIALQTLRVGSAQLPARVITEQRAGKFNADVISGDDFQISQLIEAGAFEKFRPSEAGRFLAGTVDPNGYWTNLYMNTTVIAWNPQRLAADHLTAPKSLADLGKPEWKGKLGLDGGALNWYLGTIQASKNGEELVRRVAANKPQITAGHTVTVQLLESGEFDATPTAYGYLADLEKATGKPIDYVNPRPLLVTLNPAGLAKSAPHPAAARLLLEWLLSRETQQFIGEIGGQVSSRTDVRSNPRVFDPKAPYLVVPAPGPATYNQAVTAFKTIFGIGS